MNDWTINQLVELRTAILTVLDEGRLLPDGTRAPWNFYPRNPYIPDWHMDESGDVNEQRTQFCDEIQTFLMKEAQKANVEIIDHKASAF